MQNIFGHFVLFVDITILVVAAAAPAAVVVVVVGSVVFVISALLVLFAAEQHFKAYRFGLSFWALVVHFNFPLEIEISKI